MGPEDRGPERSDAAGAAGTQEEKMKDAPHCDAPFAKNGKMSGLLQRFEWGESQ